jgi:hypothetical protein
MGSSLFPSGVGPTNSDIATAVAAVVPSPNNWTYINSVTFAGAASYSFTGLSGYKTYRVIFAAYNGSGGGIYVRFNNDSNTNYFETMLNGTPVESSYNSLPGFYISGQSNTSYQADMTIQFANNTSVPKAVKYSAYVRQSDGIWNSTAALTSITIICTNGGAIMNSGTMYLLGQN